ncbi:MAG: Phosphate binding protein [Candidatus Syntrophoarchaeum butanivorans]|uniref:Phosphate binding protein n=1 Tax=Candidatus Syntropharchaeum butanivorans TaxID=1839936 RepID=A0A1F2P411_9EURY|nr:MAG: Phosphate binding protein [Candidatus Syntrophoarchaeum butanivorans]
MSRRYIFSVGIISTGDYGMRWSNDRAGALSVLVILVASLAVSGCINDTKSGAGAGESVENVELQIAGSTTVLPIAEECARVFMEKHPGSRIDVAGGGSSHGIKAVAEGTVDIGTASRELKESERSRYPDLIPHPIAKDGVAIVVHPSNPVNSITMEELRRIYTGEITNWKDLGGVDARIMVVSREEGSGTRDCFEHAVMKPINEEITDTAIIQDSNGKVRATVAGNENAIGFLSLGYVNQDVKALKLDGVEPTVENVVNGKYPISRTLWMITKGDPDPGEEEFLDFILSEEGQEIVEELHFIPVGGRGSR